MFVLNSLINSRLKRKKGKLYTCFLDFKTVFDSIYRGVRQGCPFGVILFLIHIEDLKERWVKKHVGGAVIGKEKIFCLMFADDVVMRVETAEKLREMLKHLEKFSKEGGLEVNENKIKIVIFRKGGNIGRERWKYKGRELEICREHKYLGFWF